MLGLTMKPEKKYVKAMLVHLLIKLISRKICVHLHFGDFREIDEGRLLGANFDNLWRPHDKLFRFSNHRLGILLFHNVINTLQ